MLSPRILRAFASTLAVGSVIGGLAVPTRPTVMRDVPSRAPSDEIAGEEPSDPVVAIKLSPDGRRHAWIERQASGAGLWVADEEGVRRRLLRRTDATDLAWSADGEWLFLEAPGKLLALAMHGRSGSGIVTRLGGETGRGFLGLDGWRSAALISTESDSDGDGRFDRFGLLRAMPGGKTAPLWSGPRRVSSAMSAPDGTIWLRLVGRESITIARLDGAGRLDDVFSCRTLDPCRLATVDAAGIPYLLTAGDGDLTALYRLRTDGGIELVAIDPQHLSDAGDVAVDSITRRPMMLYLPFAGSRTVATGPRSGKLLAALGQRFPDASEVRIVQHAAGRWLIGIRRGPRIRWELTDGAGGNERPAAAYTLAQPEAVEPPRRLESFRASDGMRLFAYVTRPPQAHGALPLVVLVHGGPWSSSPVGYSETAARLARAGYLVVEPQFRASRGYGRRYLLAAGGDFGDGRVLRDIRDSADWLIERGDADRARVAIMGGSFGGYAALLAVTLWPEQFRGAIAAVPPVDFGWTAHYQALTEQEAETGLSLMSSLASLGLDVQGHTARARLKAQSPFGLAGELKRPVLILAGDRDEQVPIRSVNAYVARLCMMGKPVRYFVAVGQGHALAGTAAAQATRAVSERFLSNILRPTRASIRSLGSDPGLQARDCAKGQG